MSTRATLAAALILMSFGISACSGGGDGGGGEKPPRAAPIADAGSAQLVFKRAPVELDGTASRSADGAPLTYRWTQSGGTAVALSSTTSPRPSFTAPASSGQLTFALAVSDDVAESALATVAVTVQNRAPVAAAGQSLTIGSGHTVTLDGRDAHDPDGDVLSYLWVQRSGPSVPLISASDGTASFSAPTGPAALTFALTASDGEAPTSEAIFDVLVLAPGVNTPPQVSGGPDLSVARRSTVQVFGMAYDAEYDPLSYRWVQTSGPTVALQGATTSHVSFTAPAEECDIQLRFTASDAGASTSDSVVVRVRNRPPELSLALGPGGASTRDPLTASAAVFDADGDPVTVAYAWKKNGAAIVGQSSATLPAGVGKKGDTITVTATATDGALSASRDATLVIAPAPILLAASPPARVNHGQLLSFQVTADDPDGLGPGEYVLDHGPAGMRVSSAGAVTWTATLPMFDRSLEVSWAVRLASHPQARVAGKVVVDDGARAAPLYRHGIEIPLWNSGLQVADLDGDGRSEMLVASNHGLYELARSGSGYQQRWAYPFAPGGAKLGAVVAKDLDGDGHQEILFASGGLVVKLDGVTRRELGRYDGQSTANCVDLEIADLEPDGQQDLVCLAAPSAYYGDPARVVVFDAATLAVRWQSSALNLGSALAVGNVDADLALEIATANGYVFDGLSAQNQWAYGPGFGVGVGTGDLDGDGVEEIVGMSSWAAVRGFSAVLKSPLWEQSGFNYAALLVEDVDGDGKAEVIVGDAQWGNVTAYRYEKASNSLATLWAINSQDHGVTSIGAGDVDGDGKVEFVWGSGASSSGSDVLVIAGLNPAIAVEWTNRDPEQLDGPFHGSRPARLGVGTTALVFATPQTDSGYGGSRLVAFDPATGGLTVSGQVGSYSSSGAALAPADYDRDGVDELFVAASNQLLAYDFAARAIDWSSTAVGYATAVAAADLNGDGFDDAVALSGDGYVHAYDVKSSALIWKSTGLGAPGNDVAVADLDGDGTPEIVAAAGNRVVVYGKAASGPVPFLERASASIQSARDLLLADCDGDGAPEIHALAGAYYDSRATLYRLDANAALLGSRVVDEPVQSLHLEDLGSGRKNLVLSVGDTWSYATPLLSTVRAVDPVSGAEIWRSPPLWGTVPLNSLSYVDPDGDGTRALAFGTALGMYLTR